MNRLRNWLAGVSLPESAPPWSLTTALIALTVSFIAMLVGVTVALVWTEDRDYTQLVGLTLGGILMIAYMRQSLGRKWDALNLSGSPTPLPFVLFISFGCALALDLLSLAVTGAFLPTPELLRLNPNALGIGHWAAAIAFMVIVQPIAEGLLLRGITLPAVRTVISGWGGVLITAVISAVFHFLIYPPNYNTESAIAPIWYGLIAPLIGAMLFGAVRASSKSTRAAIAAQIAFGLFAVIKLVMLTGGA